MPPSRWRRLGRTRTSRQIRDAISEKISTLCQVSQRYARLNFLPFIRMLFVDHDYAVHLAARMNLDISEIAYVTGSKKDTKKVKTIYQEAQALIEDRASEGIEIFGGFGAREEKVRVEPEKPEKEPKKPEKKPQTSLFDF